MRLLLVEVTEDVAEAITFCSIQIHALDPRILEL